MPYSPPAGERNRIYRRLQFGRTVDLLIMDQRQYRANQPCDDATGAPAAPTTTSRARSWARAR